MQWRKKHPPDETMRCRSASRLILLKPLPRFALLIALFRPNSAVPLTGPLLRPPAFPAMVAAPKLNVGRPLYVEARANLD